MFLFFRHFKLYEKAKKSVDYNFLSIKALRLWLVHICLFFFSLAT